MISAQSIAPAGATLSPDLIAECFAKGLGSKFRGQKILVLIPDHTRSLPLPELFRLTVDQLADTRQLDFMVALGTHPALSESSLCKLVGITKNERNGKYRQIGLLNHNWKDPQVLVEIGEIESDELHQLAGNNWHESLPNKVPVRINRAALEYDQILILGPTFPHEVAGFSGGAKYLFPGISGPEMINASHWLGALARVVGTIGIKKTPVRAMIHAAASRLKTQVTLAGLVVEDAGLSGVFIGDLLHAWEAAADLSSERHIHWVEKPYQRVLSHAPAMYDELWTAGKAMYKLEPAVAKGGEVIIYAPHLSKISEVHGTFIRQIGYHILPYFLQNWQKVQKIPLGVLAHSTHVKGSGIMEAGIEKPNVRVTLSSQIPEAECKALNLGYLDPAKIRVEDFMDREDEGVLYVPKAGEMLYRVKDS